MAGGGVGIAVKEELILLHCVLDMGLGVDASALRRFAPLFVETVEKWRKIVDDIGEGKEPEPFTLPMPQGMKKPPEMQQPGDGGGYVKV